MLYLDLPFLYRLLGNQQHGLHLHHVPTSRPYSRHQLEKQERNSREPRKSPGLAQARPLDVPHRGGGGERRKRLLEEEPEAATARGTSRIFRTLPLRREGAMGRLGPGRPVASAAPVLRFGHGLPRASAIDR